MNTMGRNPLRTWKPFVAAGVGVALLLFNGGGRTSGTPAQDAQSLINTAGGLIQTGNALGLKALGVDSAALKWVDEEIKRANWKVSLLPIPGKPDSAPLAVFHDWHTCESIGDHIHTLIKTDSGWRIGGEIPEADTRGFRIRDHAMTVEYDLPNHGCRITDEVTIERTGDERIGLLRLSADMIVDSVQMAGKRANVTRVPGVIAFEAPDERKFKLRLSYHGAVNHPNSDYILPSESVLVSYWYPHIARLPAKLGLTVTVPKGWTAIGQGELVKRSDRATDSVFQFRNEIPTSYFSLDSGPYKITTRVDNGRKYSLCELKPEPGRVEKSFDDLIKSVEFFEKSFGKFPYTHFEIVETLQPFGGALEAYSFATFQRNTIPGAVVHEVAHTWWGGIVPNPYTRSMWNESFASYSDGLFHRQKAKSERSISGSQAAAASRSGKALQGMHNDARYGRGMLESYRIPINAATDTSSGSHGAVGYGKGSQVLAMLEDLLGTEMMIRCMRRFFQDHISGEAADWPDFERAVKRETGADYGWFFGQWLSRGGVPIIRLGEVTWSPRSDAPRVRGKVVQEGTPYRLKIPVAVMAGSAEVRHTIEVSAAVTEFELPAPPGAKLVKLDPDGSILMAGATLQGQTDPFSAPL